ncbi:putative NIMA interactive protein [Geopyxis carbonaria]|nr:putative NIMA interactive protein [Geopyxis carbonaria]
MDSRDLKSASNYVNNMLAGRGLLRDSPIDFSKPSQDGTAVRIINLVHDLVNRGDKDAEQRESLAFTIRTLRSNEAKNNSATEKLKLKIAELERKNSLLEAQSRTFNSTLRTHESTSKLLKDEASRLKTTLAQVRLQHANDLRKRDNTIKTMKERIIDARRGSRTAVPSIVISGAHSSHRDQSEKTLDSPTLSNDTSDFLTSLSQNLADENDNLLTLLRNCTSELKAMQGLPHNPNILEDEQGIDDPLNPVMVVPSDYSSIGLELNEIMQSLRDMLNQPDYVPLEELADREDEIIQLKNRNDILEQEWRKALDLVDMWNKIAQKTSDNPELISGKVEKKKSLWPVLVEDEPRPRNDKAPIGELENLKPSICSVNETNSKRQRSTKSV